MQSLHNQQKTKVMVDASAITPPFIFTLIQAS